MAWMVGSLDDLGVAYQRLKDNAVPIDAIVDHRISLGIYFRDPDGNGLEVSYELPRAEWPRKEQVFSEDVVNRGLFPGPWDADPAVVRRQASPPSPCVALYQEAETTTHRPRGPVIHDLQC